MSSILIGRSIKSTIYAAASVSIVSKTSIFLPNVLFVAHSWSASQRLTVWEKSVSEVISKPAESHGLEIERSNGSS